MKENVCGHYLFARERDRVFITWPCTARSTSSLRRFLPYLPPLHLNAQNTNVKPRNTNQSLKLKSGIFKGSGNLIQSNATAAFIGGGQSNKVSLAVTNAVIGGGFGNVVSNDFGTIGGGLANTARFAGAFIGGGVSNTIIPGGNVLAGTYLPQVIGGGILNTNSGHCATIGGGWRNSASGNSATISGGRSNTASGVRSFVGGGEQNSAAGAYSFAAGRRAKAEADGVFVWADNHDADFVVDSPDQFAVRAAGGVKFTSATFGLNQTVSWVPGGATWSFTSDANTKERFRALDSRDVLKRVASMPVTEWNYKGFEQRHIGPTAQDWHAAFPLNDSDTTINTADLHGVSLAAIKGLVEELKERDKAIEEMQSELKALREKVDSALAPSH